MATPSQHFIELSLNVRLSTRACKRLAERAAERGKDVATVASDLIELALASEVQSSLPYEQWAAEFRAWIAEHKRIGHFVDDSRESIYDGCGE